MSLPRDLKVEIPGHGTDKINAAYDARRPAQARRSRRSKQLTGASRSTTCINVTSRASRGRSTRSAASTSTSTAATSTTTRRRPRRGYAAIDVEPGYQKLCGQDALDYVRYRHSDNDFVRAARQQDFLRQVRSQVTFRKLLDNVDKMIDIFADNTRSDIQSTGALRRLLG